MEVKASTESESGSQASQAGATAKESEPVTAATSSSEEVRPDKAVETSISGEASGDAVETTAEVAEPPSDSQKSLRKRQKFPLQWLGFRKIFVQYIPGKPHALTEFGALLYTHHDRHEFRAIDGTGLARAVGLRNHDILLSINNLRVGVTNANPFSILECLSDVGTNIGLLVERNREEIWLFAFHLDEEANRPVVKHLFQHRFKIDVKKFSFRLLIKVVIPPEASFEETPVYEYDDSTEVEITLHESDRFMAIDTDKATFIVPKNILTLHRYKNVDQNDENVIPVAISTLTKPSDIDADSDIDPDIHSDNCNKMCIEGIGDVPLEIVHFPDCMTEPKTEIPENDKFFFMNLNSKGGYTLKAANTKQDLYITPLLDEEDPNVWIANLGITETEFRLTD